MKARIGKALAALLMFGFFATAAIGSIVLMPFHILHWWIRGLDSDEDYIYRVGKGMDGASNAILFAGNPKETISSHVGRWVKSGKPMPWWASAINSITNMVDTNHCINAIEGPFINEPL